MLYVFSESSGYLVYFRIYLSRYLDQEGLFRLPVKLLPVTTSLTTQR